GDAMVEFAPLTAAPCGSEAVHDVATTFVSLPECEAGLVARQARHGPRLETISIRSDCIGKSEDLRHVHGGFLRTVVAGFASTHVRCPRVLGVTILLPVGTSLGQVVFLWARRHGVGNIPSP